MGPKLYTEEYGKETLQHMMSKHIGKHLTEQQRKQWVHLLMESADEIDLPDDPEFRSTFVAHTGWGTRVAVRNSELAENPTTNTESVPEWGWDGPALRRSKGSLRSGWLVMPKSAP